MLSRRIVAALCRVSCAVGNGKVSERGGRPFVSKSHVMKAVVYHDSHLFPLPIGSYFCYMASMSFSVQWNEVKVKVT